MSIMATDMDLLAIPDEQFRAIVDEAIRGNLDEGMLNRLREPEVVERTYLVLVSIKKNVEGQLAAKRADYIKTRSLLRGRMSELRDAEEKYQSWRAGALRFKSGVEEFMVTVRGQRKPDPIENYYLAFQTLKHAVLQHRDHICDESCDEECAADAILWSVAEDLS